MGIVETVRIVRDSSDGMGDYTIINKRDLKKGDKIWQPPKEKPAKKAAKKK